MIIRGIMVVQKLLIYSLLTVAILFIQVGSASVFLQDSTEIPGDQLLATMNNTTNLSSSPFPIQFFYNTHCGSCQEAVEFLNGFTVKNPDITVVYHDLYNSSTNSSMFTEYKTKFNDNVNIHYPAVFIGDVVLVGSFDIASYTETLTTWYQEKRNTQTIPGFLSWITRLFSGK
jgi:glutaredoxin